MNDLRPKRDGRLHWGDGHSTASRILGALTDLGYCWGRALDVAGSRRPRMGPSLVRSDRRRTSDRNQTTDLS